VSYYKIYIILLIILNGFYLHLCIDHLKRKKNDTKFFNELKLQFFWVEVLGITNHGFPALVLAGYFFWVILLIVVYGTAFISILYLQLQSASVGTTLIFSDHICLFL